MINKTILIILSLFACPLNALTPTCDLLAKENAELKEVTAYQYQQSRALYTRCEFEGRRNDSLSRSRWYLVGAGIALGGVITVIGVSINNRQ